LQRGDDRVESGLWFTFAIEEERMVYALPGEGVQPALAIVKVPERNARNDIGVFAKETKELCVLLGLPMQNFRRTALAIRIKLRKFGAVLSAVGPPFAAWNHMLMDR